jgi:outer membrane protein assembly factor BamD (BamD/ComL family)
MMHCAKKAAWAFICLMLSSLFVLQCAGRFVTTTDKELLSADSLFYSAGDYTHARLAYLSLVTSRYPSETTEKAQYMLGYINIFYDNPFADRSAAIREFTVYQSKYPLGKRIDEVNSWLAHLHKLESYEIGYDSAKVQLKKCEESNSNNQRSSNLLTGAVLRSENVNDSLIKQVELWKTKVTTLEELIRNLAK